MTSVLQDWVQELPMMQQSVLLTAVRGPDALPKYHPSKFLLRWYRRCILLSAMDGRVLEDPVEPNGGSFTGPSLQPTLVPPHYNSRTAELAAVGTLRDRSSWAEDGYFTMGQPAPTTHKTWQEGMDAWVSAYIRGLDEVPHHYQLHFMHAVEIVGYRHPEQEIATWWNLVYERLVKDMHLMPESMRDMNHRLGDNREQWLAHADDATQD